jgi:tRNA threonylcarbamoyladenosine modification (KEOPS) complex  Pcc1 subunit
LINKSVLEIRIKHSDKSLLRSLYEALLPDTIIPAQNCIVNMGLKDNELSLKITCDKINQLRALHNSFLSIISMLIHIYSGV